MKYGLRKEIEMMMKILDEGPWRLAFNKLGGNFKYQLIDYSRFARNIVVDGVGACKKNLRESSRDVEK